MEIQIIQSGFVLCRSQQMANNHFKHVKDRERKSYRRDRHLRKGTSIEYKYFF